MLWMEKHIQLIPTRREEDEKKEPLALTLALARITCSVDSVRKFLPLISVTTCLQLQGHHLRVFKTVTSKGEDEVKRQRGFYLL